MGGQGTAQAPTPVSGYGNANGNIPVASGLNQNLVNQRQGMVDSGKMNLNSQMMQNHPFMGSLANLAMGMGQGLTKQPFLTDFLTNSTALQGKNMEQDYNVWKESQSPETIARTKYYNESAETAKHLRELGYEVDDNGDLKSLDPKTGKWSKNTDVDKLNAISNLLSKTDKGVLGFGATPGRSELQQYGVDLALATRKSSQKSKYKVVEVK